MDEVEQQDEPATEANAAPALPKLRDLQISVEDKRDWAQLPCTRAWFKSLQNLALQIQNTMIGKYQRDSSDKTLSGIAESVGAVNILYYLMSQQIDESTRLFSEQDLEEEVDD